MRSVIETKAPVFTVVEAFPINHECSIFGITGPEHRLALNTVYAAIKDAFPDEHEGEARAEAYWTHKDGQNPSDVVRGVVTRRYLKAGKKRLIEGCRYFGIKGFSKMDADQMATAIMSEAMSRVQH